MPARDSDATRRRLLESATAEFAAYGVAGARVDRIAATAGVNKARLYDYYGDKLRLFDAVFRHEADAVTDSSPFTALDLPAYAVRLLDVLTERPALARLLTWARLEQVTSDTFDTGMTLDDAKLAAVTEAQQSGAVTAAIAAEDILKLTVSMALTWSAASLTHYGAEDTEADRQRHREALSLAVSRLLNP
ncbi:TetR/AcrR family transcriptional regulator [Actinoplanes sp. NPDC049265]|uniref:TetR/AcrR family transcriptional regulator n=1 Tax=Actinoplanes sp. NPDC049265 TaxID=3363902 RepID=UPI0037193D81